MLRCSGCNPFGTKGQFFVISIVIITTTLIGVMSMIEAYGDISVTEIHEYEEDKIFRNVVEGLESTAMESGCEYGTDSKQPRQRNLLDYNKMVGEDLSKHGIRLTVDFDSFCPTEATVEMKTHGFETRETVFVPSDP